MSSLSEEEWSAARHYVGALLVALADWCASVGVPRRLGLSLRGYYTPRTPDGATVTLREISQEGLAARERHFDARISWHGRFTTTTISSVAELRTLLELPSAEDRLHPDVDIWQMVDLIRLTSGAIASAAPPSLALGPVVPWLDPDNFELVAHWRNAEIGASPGDGVLPVLHGFYRPVNGTERRRIRIEYAKPAELHHLYSFMWSQLGLFDPDTGAYLRGGPASPDPCPGNWAEGSA